VEFGLVANFTGCPVSFSILSHAPTNVIGLAIAPWRLRSKGRNAVDPLP
jgi:hypothetical protein